MSESFEARKSNQPFDQNHSLVAVIELSRGSWLVGGIVPGLDRRPLKKLEPSKEKLFALLSDPDPQIRVAMYVTIVRVTGTERAAERFWLMGDEEERAREARDWRMDVYR